MAATTNDSTSSYSQIPYLSPRQQDLLLAALSSQKKTPANGSRDFMGAPQKSLTDINTFSPSSSASPTRDQADDLARSVNPSMLSSSVNGRNVGLETPQRTGPAHVFGSANWADFDANGGFNFDTVKDEAASNGLNYNSLADGSSPELEGREKRKDRDSDEDEDDDYDDDDQPTTKTPNGKVSKKPGRKPLTSEPTNKRKAQNRAAQRAFRERKEKHLKDLEQKVEDLEHASASTKQENGLLKATIAKMQTEIEDYRKRLTVVSSALGGSSSNSFSSFAANRNSTDFNFDFPRFGSPKEMPGSKSSSSPMSTNDLQNPSMINRTSQHGVANGRDSLSPHNFNPDSPSMNGIMQSTYGTASNNITWPNTSNSVDRGNNSPGLWRNNSNVIMNDHGLRAGQQLSPAGALSGYATSNIDSPPHLASHNGSSSSSTTSPEPYNRNRGAIEGLSETLNSNYGNGSVQPYPVASQISEPEIDFSNFDWLSNNNGRFDPLLFGDYRESQDAVVGGGEFTGGLYDEPYDFTNAPDFSTSLFEKAKPRTPSVTNASLPTNDSNKTYSSQISTSLMEQVDKQKEGTHEGQRQQQQPQQPQAPAQGSSALPKRKGCPEMMTAKKIWSHLKKDPRFESGQFDIDSLCMELSQKATCSETGMNIPTKDVEKALWRLATNGTNNGAKSGDNSNDPSRVASGKA